MNKNRPMNLDLTTIKMPVTAIASILHRISGLVLFLCLPVALYLLNLSLTSRHGFERAQEMLTTMSGKILLLMALAAIIYHIVAGVRHLFADMGLGEELATSRLTAKAAIVISLLLTLLAGAWIW